MGFVTKVVNFCDLIFYFWLWITCFALQELLGYPLSMKQLTSTPISFRGNQDDYCLPHPAISTITVSSGNCFKA